MKNKTKEVEPFHTSSLEGESKKKLKFIFKNEL